MESELEKAFVVTSLCRQDLVELGVTTEQLAALTDEDMEAIARVMENVYVDNDFWFDLREAANKRLKAKNLEEIPEADDE